ncbi:MAG TPA: hypothetical protein VIJ82_24370 [Streptosporangiaceae bacterium]
MASTLLYLVRHGAHQHPPAGGDQDGPLPEEYRAFLGKVPPGERDPGAQDLNAAVDQLMTTSGWIAASVCRPGADERFRACSGVRRADP